MDLIGQRIRHLLIEERLGQGGMGEVYLARDLVLDRLVAVKTLRADQRFSEEGKARFLREARLLSKLGDPGICQIYEILETPEADYLVLEYVRGRTLKAAAGALTLAEKLGLLVKVARALAFAHRAGVVHRDLKADNLMVTPEGGIKILDFGVGRSLADSSPLFAAPEKAATPPPAAELGETELLPPPIAAPKSPAPLPDPAGDATAVIEGPETRTTPSSAGITRQGTVVGTLGAMSPEQAAGAPISETSDLYSFGILMQELLTGHSAYGDARGVPLWHRVLRAETEPIRGLDSDLVGLLRELLSLDPLRRPGAELVAARLGEIAEKPERERKRRRRRQWVAAAFLVLLVGLAVTLNLALAARKARDIAEKRRQVAEDLIAFMLGNLSDRLQEVGRLDILDAVDERALAYFDALPEGELSAEELGWRLQGMRQVAEVYRAKGDPERARQAVARARQLAGARAVARFDDDFGIARAQFELLLLEGQIAFDTGEIPQAAQSWRASLDLAETLAARWPAPDSRLLLASARHNLGSLLDQQGRLDEAITLLRSALESEEAAFAAGATDTYLVGLRAATRAYLSRALERQGDLRGALEIRRQYLAELEDAWRREPENAVFLFDLAVARGFVAGLEMVLGQWPEAAALYRSGGAAMARLVALDPQNAEAAMWLSRFEATPAELLMALGDPAAAAAGLDRAQRLLEDLARRQPGSPDLAEGLAIVHLRRGLLFAKSAPERALNEASLAATGLRQLLSPTAELSLRTNLANAELLRGQLLAQAGRPAEAAAGFAATAALLAPLERPLRSSFLLEIAFELELERGELAAATATLAQLDAMGWHGPRRPRLEERLQQLRKTGGAR